MKRFNDHKKKKILNEYRPTKQFIFSVPFYWQVMSTKVQYTCPQNITVSFLKMNWAWQGCPSIVIFKFLFVPLLLLPQKSNKWWRLRIEMD